MAAVPLVVVGCVLAIPGLLPQALALLAPAAHLTAGVVCGDAPLRRTGYPPVDGLRPQEREYLAYELTVVGRSAREALTSSGIAALS